MIIYHIVLPEDWAAATGDLYYAASLETEGFIHCSYSGQLDAVIERYYAGTERVVVLQIDTDKLMSRVVNEPSTNSEIYPHIYGPINRGAVISARERQLS
jgi:uncharacterized protein (DUF952 family)